MSKTITVTFKESEKELCDKFKKKYSSPGAIIKDFIKQDLEENKKKQTSQSSANLPRF